VSDAAEQQLTVCRDGVLAARLFVIDPHGFGGIVVRSAAGPVRDLWLTWVQSQIVSKSPWVKMPCNVDDDRMLGGLDFAVTLQTGRPVAQTGLLAQANGGTLVCAMAERLPFSAAARVAQALDNSEVVVDRDGFSSRASARFGVIALDESVEPDECVPTPLSERLAFWVDLSGVSMRDAVVIFDPLAIDVEDVRRAQALLMHVEIGNELIQALCNAAMAFGISSLRTVLQAVRAARAISALESRSSCTEIDIADAARLVFAPRARIIPQAPAESDQTSTPASNEPESSEAAQAEPSTQQPMQDQVIAATRAAIPVALLASVVSTGPVGRRAQSGRAGTLQKSLQRGRVVGVMRTARSASARLNVLATLRTAIPWQKLRMRPEKNTSTRIALRAEDFRVNRFKQRTQTTTVIAMDASGSLALHRMAEAKGAVELLLAQCYVRRDHVAVIAFRGKDAEVLLPPSRSLTRAKRALAGLPGGGATPLARGIESALAVADSVRRKGETPSIVLLTDGQANMSLNGVGGRAQAQADALRLADQVRAAGIQGLLIDTSPQPQQGAFEVANRMGARYLPLPHADARTLTHAIQASASERRG
jgi:magnesium chelatase subunit D